VLVTMTATGGPATTARTGFEQFEVTRGGAGIPTAPGAPPATQTVTCPATSPRPVTSRTTILDVTPPQVLLRAPAHGAVYTTGDSAKVDFGCSDAAGTMTTCSGTAANGSQLATGSAGTKTFVVDGTDAAGNTAEAFASYVVHPPTVTYTANVDWNMLAGMNSASQRFGIPIQDIPKAGVGLIMFLRALDPSGAPNPIVPPPANSGPIAVPSTYPYAQQIGIENLAAFYSVTGDQLHWLGAGLLVYLDAISPH
jgi:hypothetical protein